MFQNYPKSHFWHCNSQRNEILYEWIIFILSKKNSLTLTAIIFKMLSSYDHHAKHYLFIHKFSYMKRGEFHFKQNFLSHEENLCGGFVLRCFLGITLFSFKLYYANFRKQKFYFEFLSSFLFYCRQFIFSMWILWKISAITFIFFSGYLWKI